MSTGKNSLSWRYCAPEATELEICELETYFGVRFPPDYRTLVRSLHGGRPRPRCYDMPGRTEAVFESLLCLRPISISKECYGVQDLYPGLSRQMPAMVFPFASDPFGNYICFDYRKDKQKPTVVFWDHEAADPDHPDNAIHPICDTFTRLLDMLYESKKDD